MQLIRCRRTADSFSHLVIPKRRLAANLGMLIFVLFHHAAPAMASGPEQVVRARALEIVDAQGKVRASISITPEGPGRKADGSPTEFGDRSFPEAVVLRLIRQDGRPSVKIATTEQGLRD